MAMGQLRAEIGLEIKPEFCTQCGKCSSGCPAARLLDIRPRKIVLMAYLGMEDEVLRSGWLWMCSDCLACEERCPYQVGPYSIIMALRELYAEKGLRLPSYYGPLTSSLLKTGFSQAPIRVRTREFKRVDRESLGLQPPRGPMDMKRFSENLKAVLGGVRA